MWLYDKDNSISKRAASKELREVYGNEGFGDNVCGIWLKRFRDGNKNIDDLDDKPRSGRPSTLNDEELRLLVEMDPKATVRELAEVLQKSVSMVWTHLQDMGFVSFLHLFCYSTVKDQQVGKMAPAPAIRLEQRDAICRCAREFGEVSSRKFEFG